MNFARNMKNHQGRNPRIFSQALQTYQFQAEKGFTEAA
jgi:hypothetical protein